MPRDFVPVLYREYTMQDTPRLDYAVFCCDVTELFAICALGSHMPEVVIGPNSHQDVMRLRCQPSGPGDIPGLDVLAHREGMRHALFQQFNRLMAALE